MSYYVRGKIWAFYYIVVVAKVFIIYILMYCMASDQPIIIQQQGAVFNSGLANLELLHDITKNIVKVSTLRSPVSEDMPGFIPKGKAQHIKYDLIKQLFIHSSILLKDDPKFFEQVKKSIFDMEKKLDYVKRVDTMKNQTVGVHEAYIPELEFELDNMLLLIKLKLQQLQKLYMPSRSDPRHAFRQR